MTRTRVSTNNFGAHIESERTIPMEANEMFREDVFQDGNYIGQISYFVRKAKSKDANFSGTSYGWVPSKHPRMKQTNKVEAIRRLDKYEEVQ